MTAPSGYCILDGDGGSVAAARPARDCETVGGGLFFQDSAANPPRTHEHPASADWHQMEMLISRAYDTIPLLNLSFTAGTSPAINSVVCCSDNVTVGNVTVTRSTVGLYRFVFPVSALPATTFPPRGGAYGTTTQGLPYPEQTGHLVDVQVKSGTTPIDTGNYWFSIFGL